MVLGLLEQVSNPRCADAHEHLHEVGPGDVEEGNIRLPGDGPGQERLAAAGRSGQEHALGDLRPHCPELLRLAQELDDLLQLLLGLVHARHVVEGHALVGVLEPLVAALPEGDRLPARRLHLAHEHEVEEQDEGDGQDEVAHDLDPGLIPPRRDEGHVDLVIPELPLRAQARKLRREFRIGRDVHGELRRRLGTLTAEGLASAKIHLHRLERRAIAIELLQ